MPKVTPLTEEKRFEQACYDFAFRTETIMRKHKISKSTIARKLGISPQAVHQQFARDKISTDTLMAVVQLADLTDEEAGRLLRV